MNDCYWTFVKEEHKGFIVPISKPRPRPIGKDGKPKTDLQLEMYDRNNAYRERSGDKRHRIRRKDYRIQKELLSHKNAESYNTPCPCGMRNIETAKGHTYSKMG